MQIASGFRAPLDVESHALRELSATLLASRIVSCGRHPVPTSPSVVRRDHATLRQKLMWAAEVVEAGGAASDAQSASLTAASVAMAGSTPVQLAHVVILLTRLRSALEMARHRETPQTHFLRHCVAGALDAVRVASDAGIGGAAENALLTRRSQGGMSRATNSAPPSRRSPLALSRTRPARQELGPARAGPGKSCLFRVHSQVLSLGRSGEKFAAKLSRGASLGASHALTRGPDGPRGWQGS